MADLLSALVQLPADWAIVPVGSNKNAYLPGWNKRRIAREDTIKEIGSGRAVALGLCAGPLSNGLMMIDFDGFTSVDALADIGMTLADFPKTVAWTSGREGRHQRTYRVPEEYWPAIASRQFRTKEPNGPDDKGEQLELRWAGLQSVIIGHHPVTGGYRWCEGCSPWEVEVADCPLPLIEAMLKEPEPLPPPPPRAVVHAAFAEDIPLEALLTREHAQQFRDGVGEGGRDNAAAAIARDLLGAEAYCQQHGVRYYGDPHALLADFAARCTPPLSKRDVDRIFRSAQRSNPSPAYGIDSRVEYHQRPRQEQTVRVPQQPAGRPTLTLVTGGAMPAEDVDADDAPPRPDTVTLSMLTKESDYLPLVLQHVFRWPETPWACVGGTLHRWCGTHYEPIEDEELAPAVADFLGQLAVTPRSGAGQVTHPFARPRCVKESLEWLRHCIGATQANPANAINCRNGVVSWTWRGDDLQVSFDAHSPERVFTYVTDYDYQPNIDREPMDRLLAALNNDQRTTIQRALGSSLDLAKYRARRGRPRALLMLGGGSNGKDTLRGVMQAALGDRKATICSMSDFRQYDQGRKFPLAPLRDSSLNWPSENTEFISLDDLQSVKSAISGDPLSWEVKGAQEQSFIPSCLLVFNCNKPPLLSGADEAVRTRWYVCEFSKTFTSTPTKPDELPADPRFKDDPEFVTKELAPAFLLWLLEGLQDAVRHGIDYSSGGVAMTRIRAMSCHLWEFAEDYGLEPDPDGTIAVSAIYDALKVWYRNEGVLDENGRWNDGVLKDKPVKAPRNLVDRLRSVFPNITTRKEVSTRRTLIQGLKHS
jgi:phage/plasmid-associated DNA primase